MTLYPEAKRRVRWLNKEEATRLLDALPTHQRQLTRFALATGLRQANVLGLKWSDVDMDRRTAWVHADEAKGGEAIGVPLNDEAMAVLREEKGKHPRARVHLQGQTAWSGEHEVVAQCLEARRHQELSLARLAARVGHVARHGRYDDGGTAGAWRVEVRS